MVRGLVERKPHPSDSRKMIYSPSAELLAYLGVSKIEDLPDYVPMREEISKVKTGINSEKADVET